METVFSDPVGDKVSFLKAAAESGYSVVLIFIGISSADISEERVSMRVAQGGHDVPTEKLQARFSRTIANLQTSITELPCVMIYDNSDLANPYKEVAAYNEGKLMFSLNPLPPWFPKKS